ncbi:MAG TPA: thioredoxin [Candidatus Limnocylindria bacterium]|nr:thioredoxin [Candidatus Limnocylindria bacterium]
MSEFVQNANDGNFTDAVLNTNKPVLVDFWAPWCAPCRALTPIVDALADQYAGAVQFMKVNVDDNPQAAQRYGVQAIPTLILFRGGEEKQRMVGVSRKEVIAQAIDLQVDQAN